MRLTEGATNNNACSELFAMAPMVPGEKDSLSLIGPQRDSRVIT
jgi:hypothetical protein